MRTRYLFLIVFIAFALVSCGGGKKIKPPAPEAVMAKKAFEVANAIKRAYVNKDLAALKRYCTKRGYLSIIASMKEFDSAVLVFKLRWVEIKKDHMILYLDWQGSWKIKDKTFEEKGLAALSFVGNPPLLDDILRANPFGQPE